MGEWRVKYDGVCSRCGIALHAGEVAVYDRPTRSIHCVSCPSAADPEPPEIDAGVAGRSARQEHDRRAAKREAAIKERWGTRIDGVVLALTDEPQSTRAWATGARGEEKLATALDGFSVLHDRRVPRTRGNIDHIVIAPAGVFVVDAKSYQGRIDIRNHGWFLRPDERLRYDVADGKGAITLRRAGRLHHLNIGAAHARQRVLAIVDEHEVTVVALDTGEVLSTHLIEPDRRYWRNQRRDPGRWPGSPATG